ncbi:MAG: serine--tRNA ligase [Solobacterium sp.]|nr:serine--tRNA ligase [Solobacterium sp.]MDY2953205.1 serine--tRNA ligase [Erysipelotrichaceae bacterium]MCI7156987.1 serine--tRNA ligase [Solobacterium sp.]MDD7776701.1 serine--tRNA ligase [Solobacterium sp.]MDY4493962.1 serine--tRNA ligase [Erysipelotrichaceae bacterium]
MIDIKLIRENPELVKENIKKKFQDQKLELVDEVKKLDEDYRALRVRADELRGRRNTISKEIGQLMKQGLKEKAEEVKAEVAKIAKEIEESEVKEIELEAAIKKIMMVIPNIVDPSVPVGKDDSENVEIEQFGTKREFDFEIPYHVDIMEKLDGIDLDAARKTSGNGFYYLKGDIARLHSSILSYARDFMINRGYTYYIPPFMIRSDVVTGVMSFSEMENMMYKIEGEDLYLIGTSEHSMIGKFIDTIIDEDELPQKLTSYSPCFRKEVGAHGIEERGVYRIHQFEKQEMIIVCKPEDSMNYYNEMWKNSVDFFLSMDIPVRTLECCTGDLADLKVKSCDVEAWSPRQKKYFEVGSCSNLGDAQARRLKIRIKGEKGNYFAHTLNNTVVAPPRMLIAFLENNLNADGSINIPKALQPYMGGMEKISPKK